MLIIEGLEQANEMRSGSQHDQNVEDLMGAAQYVKPSWPPTLWYPGLRLCQ
jgi:hypothetical protein